MVQTVKKLSSQRSDKGLWIYRSETNGFDSRKAKYKLSTIEETRRGIEQLFNYESERPMIIDRETIDLLIKELDKFL